MTDREVVSTIAPGGAGYWDIAGGEILTTFTTEKNGQYSPGKYVYCHRYKQDGTVTLMEYHYEGNSIMREPAQTFDIPNSEKWEVHNNKLIMWNDTFNIVKCDSDSLILRSHRTSIAYKKSTIK